MKLNPERVSIALAKGVQKAAGSGDTRNITTVITRPLWRIWNVAMGQHPDKPPTEWSPDEECNRIFGSETIVVESEHFAAASFAKR